MTTGGQLIPAIKASGAIVDPEILLEAIAFGDDPPVVAQDTRLDFFGGQVVLLFTGSKFIPLTIPEPQDRFPYYPLWYFIKYRSRVNYNVVMPERLALDPASLSASTTVTFTVRRLVEVMREETTAGETRQFWHHETEAHQLREWGVVRAEFKKLKRYASEQQRPFDIGRHAPRGEDLRVIDVRRLLDEPLSRTVFRESVVATRQAIDAYFAYLRARGKTE